MRFIQFTRMKLASLAAPGTYSPEKCNLSRQPSFTFGTKSDQKVRSDTPGKRCSVRILVLHVNYHENSLICTAPSAYATEKVNQSFQPAYSFGLRPEEKIKSDIPGNFVEQTKFCFIPANG